MVTSDFSPEVEIRPFRACAMKNTQYNPSGHTIGRIAQIFASFRKSGSGNTMMTSDFSPEVEIRPLRARAMHPDIIIIIETVRSLWTWLWGRYHVDDDDDDDCRFVKRITQDASTALRVPVRCEEVSFQR